MGTGQDSCSKDFRVIVEASVLPAGPRVRYLGVESKANLGVANLQKCDGSVSLRLCVEICDVSD